jgi:ribosomal protein S3AE
VRVRLRGKKCHTDFSVFEVLGERSGTRRKGSSVNDQLDVRVHDSDVLAEIEMMTRLIIAASEHDAPLPQALIDELLGITPTLPRARQP